MNRRSIVLLSCALVSMGAAPFAARAAVDPIVREATSLLGAIARNIPKPSPVQTVTEPESTDTRFAYRGTPERARTKAWSRRTPTPPKPSGGILVRRDVVRAAVRRGVRPSASPVAATQDRPAGLAVYGWSAAGAGLADGDIITRVGGRTPTSIDDVVVAVAGAYKARSYVVSGQIWRNGQILAVTVELPKPDAKSRARESQRPASRSTGGP